MASDDFSDPRDVDVEFILRRYYDDAGSIRELSRRTGIAYSTLQGIISGKVASPSQRTRDRLEAAYEATPITRRARQRTVVDDSILWTPSKLANLVPPPGATKFQLIGVAPANRGGTAYTRYIDLETKVPADFLLEPGFDARSLSRVVWAFGRRG